MSYTVTLSVVGTHLTGAIVFNSFIQLVLLIMALALPAPNSYYYYSLIRVREFILMRVGWEGHDGDVFLEKLIEISLRIPPPWN